MPTLLHDLQDYLSYKESYLRPDSFKVYRNFGAKFKAFIELRGLSDMPTKKVNASFLEQYRLHILRMHSDSTTRNKEIIQLKIFCNQLTKPGWARFSVSPARHLQCLPKKDSELHEPYNDEQVQAIFGAILAKKDYPLLLFIYFIHYTFARPGKEVRLMKVGDLKPRTAVIRAVNSKTRRTKTPTIPKPLEQLIDYLKIRNYPADWYIFGSEGTPGVIPVGKGCYYHRHKKILTELGLIGKYTVYGWKHTGNIRAIILGIDERQLQTQNGFADFRTFEIYIRRLSAYVSDEIYDKFV